LQGHAQQEGPTGQVSSSGLDPRRRPVETTAGSRGLRVHHALLCL